MSWGFSGYKENNSLRILTFLIIDFVYCWVDVWNNWPPYNVGFILYFWVSEVSVFGTYNMVKCSWPAVPIYFLKELYYFFNSLSMRNLLQSNSSLPSSHSSLPSHCHLVGIQRAPLAHLNWELRQVTAVGETTLYKWNKEQWSQ